MNISKSPLSPHLLNGTPNYHQNVNTNTSEANRNSCETNKNVPKPEHQQSRTRNKKQTFVGNLSNDLHVKYLEELFGLATGYLIENCSITMPITRKTGKKNKAIAFILSPGQVHNELLKLNPLSANPTKWSNTLKQFNSTRDHVHSKKKKWTTTAKTVS